MPYECASPLASAAVSLAGVAVGGLVGFLSARRISVRNVRAVAAAKFRATFAPALATFTASAMRSTAEPNRPDISSYLGEHFIEHASAVEEFRPFVHKKERTAYQRAWDQYLELEPVRWGGSAEYMAKGLSPEAPSKLVQARIEAVLRFGET